MAEWWMVVLTVAIIIVMVLQLAAFVLQAFALRKTVDTMRDTAQRQLRAYVTAVDDKVVIQDPEKNTPFRFRPLIINVGQTPAHNVWYAAHAQVLRNPLPDNFPVPDGYRRIAKPYDAWPTATNSNANLA